MGRMSRIETYRHHPLNNPKVMNPRALAISRTGIVSRITDRYGCGMWKSNRVK
jgi:hypothetical protein